MSFWVHFPEIIFVIQIVLRTCNFIIAIDRARNNMWIHLHSIISHRALHLHLCVTRRKRMWHVSMSIGMWHHAAAAARTRALGGWQLLPGSIMTQLSHYNTVCCSQLNSLPLKYRDTTMLLQYWHLRKLQFYIYVFVCVRFHYRTKLNFFTVV